MAQIRALLHPDPVYIPGSGYAPAAGSTPAPAATPAVTVSKFKPQEQRMPGSDGHGEDRWVRPPNATGRGATHVKSFHCKLTGDSLDLMDKQINEWLDAHPGFEVKFCTASVGEWSGKSMKEPNLVLQVWI
jgi:hypothetical protein